MTASDNRYDFWLNLGTSSPLGFNTYISKDHPYERSTADYRKEQINSAAGTGDVALTGWWTQGQLSFHGGGGLRYDTQWDAQTDIRFDTSTAVDAYRAGELRVGYGLTAITGPSSSYNSMATEDGTGVMVAQSAPGTVDVINAGSGQTWTRFPSPGDTAQNLSGVAGEASAYLRTTNTIERCWPVANRPAIRDWSMNPLIAGSVGTMIPGVFIGDSASGSGAGSGSGVGWGPTVTGTNYANVGTNGQFTEFHFVQPGASVIYNLARNSQCLSPAGAGGVAPAYTNVSGTWLTQPSSFATGGTTPVSSNCIFASGNGIAGSSSWTLSFSQTIQMPAYAAAGQGLAIAFKAAITDTRLATNTFTVQTAWDGAAATTVYTSTGTAGTGWGTSLFNPGSAAIPTNGRQCVVTVTWSGTSAAGSGSVGTGIVATDFVFSPMPTTVGGSGNNFWGSLSGNPTYFDSVTPINSYGGVQYTGRGIGGRYGCSILAASTNSTVPVTITVRADSSATPVAISGVTTTALSPAPKSLPNGTWVIAVNAVNGVASVAIPPVNSNATLGLRLAVCTDALKDAVSDGTSVWSSTGWTWDGTTNMSTQTFTGANYSEPIVYLPPGTGTTAETFVGVWWAKSRLIALSSLGNWYQFGPSARHIATGTDIFWTVPAEDANASIPWVVREGPDGIYIGHSNRIWVANLDVSSGTSGPTVTQVTAVADDEVVQDLSYYLGQLTVCTDHGMRAARLNLYGRLILGPRFMEGNFTTCTPWDDTVLVSGTRTFDGVTQEQGVFAISMVVDNDQNTTIPAFWNEWSGTPPLALAASVYNGENDAATQTHLTSWGTPLMLDSAGHLQQLTANAASSGVMKTARIRLGTLDNKVYRYLTVRTDGSSGTVAVTAIIPSGATFTVGTVSAGSTGTFDLAALTNFPTQGAEWVQLQFTLTGAVKLTGWQIKAQPNPTRQRMIKVPLALYDTETSIYGTTSYQSAAQRMLALEALEDAGAMVTYTDRTTGDSGSAYIESIEVVRIAPASAQANAGGPSFGGIIQLTLRKA